MDRLARFAIAIAFVALLAVTVTGCGKKDDQGGGSTGYYSGPMKPKGAANGSAGAKGAAGGTVNP